MLAVNSFTPKSVKCFSLKEEGLISQLSTFSTNLIFYLNVSRRMDKKRNISLMTYVEMQKETEVLHKNVRSELVAFKQGSVFCAKSYYFKESFDDFINLKEA